MSLFFLSRTALTSPQTAAPTKLDADIWRYNANRMDARRRQFDLWRVDVYI